MMMEYAFGISEVTTKPWSFEEDIARYPALGAAAIEIWENKLDDDADRRRAQLLAAFAHGLEICSFQARVHSLYPTHLSREPAAFDARLERLHSTLDSVGTVLPGTVFVLNTGVAAGGDVARAFRESVPAYRELAAHARRLNVRLAIEPLHPLAMNEDSFAWTLEGALELTEAIAHPAFGICADIWNLAGQFELGERLARCGDRIFLAQVSDWRTPRSFLDRLPVGEGDLDFKPFLRGLHAAGYDGPLVLEIFSDDVDDSLYAGDVAAMVRRSRESLDLHQRNALRPSEASSAIPAIAPRGQ
jgi:sugar phosphate isomerase/epimerase